jgi:BirA family biotin operon repressor/biotin-[acetyl-CoA-carboxylase] ligase
VIGIGINCRRTSGVDAGRGRKPAFLHDYVAVPRSRVIQEVGRALLEALEAFEAHGLDALRADWQAMDAHAGQRLRVRLADGRVLSGVASGLAEDGALQLRTRGGLREVRSGRVVSARAA